MDLRHLNTFIVLCQIKNFTQTAEYLHYAQSNVTTQIQQLEKELNTRLFERIGKKVILTPAAMELQPYAEQILHLVKDVKDKFSHENSNQITVGVTESLCIYRLPAIIKEFQAIRPSAELYLQVLDTSDFISMLSGNTIDIAFSLDTCLDNPNIKTAYQIEEEICLFSRPEHILSKKNIVSIDDLVEQRLILTSKDCCYRKLFEKDLLKASKTPQIALETSSVEVIKQSVLSGLGICLLPRLAVQKELDKKELVKINYNTDYKITSQLFYHKDKWLSQNLIDFIDVVKQNYTADS